MNGPPEPSRGIPRLVHKIRTEGIGWISKRLAHEILQPSTKPGRAVHALARGGIAAVAAVPRRLRRMSASRSLATDQTLFAFYDLKVAPLTFDFLWFLAAAELRRRELALEHIHVVIMPGPYEGVRRESEDYERVVNVAARKARVKDILVASCPLLPTCLRTTVAASREEGARLRSAVAARVFPLLYEPALPTHVGPQSCLNAARRGDRSVGALRATPDSLCVVDQWIAVHSQGRRLVVITLRNYGYMAQRNSNLEAWTAFARSIDARKYLPVFLPDTADARGQVPAGLGEFVVYSEAASDVALRMAIYERAFLNLGVNTGPMGLCWLNELAHYATLKMSVQGVSFEYYRFLGFEWGKSLPFATPTQEFVWEDDTPDAIERAFVRLAERIDRGVEPGAASPATAVN
jgi:hypothetical protein